MNDRMKTAGYAEMFLWLFRLRRRFRVTGASMQPLFRAGEDVLVDLRAYRNRNPQRGDIVVAAHPFRPDLRLLKRIADSKEDGRYFLEGLNPNESTDSRSFGLVDRKNILGRVTSRIAQIGVD